MTGSPQVVDRRRCDGGQAPALRTDRTDAARPVANPVDADSRRDVSRPCGRFAPSPTGPLHFGSLVAALGSFLNVRRAGGRWFVRIDDLDTARNVPGAADSILRDLERLALPWDGEVIRQATRTNAHAEALDALARRGRTFACACSRRDLAGGVYPGTCRTGIAPDRSARSVRFRVDASHLRFHDRIQGATSQCLRTEVGDFVVLRADGVVAYHLAVVVDDAEQCVTEVVRGCDLLESTPRQILIQRALGLPTPTYAHLPIAVGADDRKLSKQNLARPVSAAPAGPVLVDALQFLGQRPPRELAGAGAAEIVTWAVGAWDLARVPRRRSAPVPDHAAEPRLRSCLQ